VSSDVYKGIEYRQRLLKRRGAWGIIRETGYGLNSFTLDRTGKENASKKRAGKRESTDKKEVRLNTMSREHWTKEER